MSLNVPKGTPPLLLVLLLHLGRLLFLGSFCRRFLRFLLGVLGFHTGAMSGVTVTSDGTPAIYSFRGPGAISMMDDS